ncbi:MAG: DUF1365 domain-containing protein [Planctomycetes bacterium]|nr:DUF1365 domain-containing protein [Planctomycetota bacterium]
MVTDSCLYVGQIDHRRFKPKRHAFTYDVGMAFLDIDKLEDLCAISPWLSYDRWNWAAFCNRDHIGDPKRPLRERLREDAARSGVALPDGPIRLLTNLRYLGHCFNPVSYYYCYSPDGALHTIMAELHNTWHETHTYWMPPALTEPGRRWSYRFPKSFHVSPFVSMACDYRFAFGNPADRLGVHVSMWEKGDFFFDATMRLERRAWSHAELVNFLARFPWHTVKVIAAIHWEALKLWLKRVPVFTHPKKLARRNPVS